MQGLTSFVAVTWTPGIMTVLRSTVTGVFDAYGKTTSEHSCIIPGGGTGCLCRLNLRNAWEGVTPAFAFALDETA